MPISFHCTNAACNRVLTVRDEAAGKPGKCPSCGTGLVVPRPADEPPGMPELLDDDEPLLAPPPKPARKAAWPVVRFDVVGQAWGLFREAVGTWILALLVAIVALVGFSIVVGLLQMVAGGGALTNLVAVPLRMAIQGVLMGGLYRMALRQVDGKRFGVGDMLNIGDVTLDLAIASILVGLGQLIGFLMLVIPGLVFAGLTMFALPMIVDGRKKGWEAVGESLGMLKGDWLAATVLQLVLSIITAAGFLLCGVGAFLTYPIYVLGGAILYRDFYAKGAKPRVAPDELELATARPRGRVPAWGWATLAAGLLIPLILIVVLVVSAAAIIGSATAAGRPPMPINGAPPSIEFNEGQRKMIEEAQKKMIEEFKEKMQPPR